MNNTVALPLIVNAVSFAVLVILIFVIRAKDKQNTKISNVRKMVSGIIGKIEATDESFKKDIEDIENQIAKKEELLKDKIQSITVQINQIDSYSEDLARLRLAMNTYQDALAGLGKLTTEADEKIKQVEDDINKLNEVRTVIENFRAEMTSNEEKLHNFSEQVMHMENVALLKMDDSSKAVVATCDNYLAKLDERIDKVCDLTTRYIGELDEKLGATQKAATLLHEDGADMLKKLGNSAENQIELAQKIQELEEDKMVLEGTLYKISKSVDDKISVKDEFGDLSQEVSERLTKVKSEFENLAGGSIDETSVTASLQEEVIADPVNEESDSDLPDWGEDEEKPAVEYTGEEEEIPFN